MMESVVDSTTGSLLFCFYVLGQSISYSRWVGGGPFGGCHQLCIAAVSWASVRHPGSQATLNRPAHKCRNLLIGRVA